MHKWQQVLIGICIAGISAIALAADDLAKIKADLERKLPGGKIDQIKPAPLAGLYELVIQGQVVYTSADGRYILYGDLYDRVDSVNLTEQTRNKVNSILLAEFDDSKTIVFGPKNPKYTVTVFTDTTCGYCRQLHKEVPELNSRGVKVRYMLFPRAGLSSPAYNTMQSIWCSANRQEALTTAKSGGQVPVKTCANPIAEHMSLAQMLGLQGTPMIITENGKVVGGYVQVDQLVSMLEAEARSQ